MKKPVITVIAVAVLLAAAAYFITHRSVGDRATLRVSGNIEVTSVEVSFKIPGRVKERLADEGEMVKDGQVIARLEREDLLHEVALRAAEVQAAQAALAELEAGSRKEEIARGEAALAAAEADAKRLDDDFVRQKELFARETIPRQKFDAALAARDTSSARVREAREALTLLRKGPRKERIDQARARLRQVESALALARERFAYAEVAAPLTGMVLAKHVEPGEQVAAGTPVITVGDMANTWVRAYIAESDLGRVKVGQKARVRTDTYPDKHYAGTVSFIAQEAEFTPKNVQTEKERVKLVYRIKITIPNPRMELKPGMPADAEIMTGTGDRGPGTGN